MNYETLDRSVIRKSADVEEKIASFDGVPMPAIVELNIFGACNRACDFCPVSNPEVYTNVNEGLEIELARKIAADLQVIGFKGIVLFSAFSEPFLHKKLFELVSLFRMSLPDCSVHIVSNGDAIKAKPALLSRVMTAGVSQLSLSLYDGDHQFECFVKIMNEQLSETDKRKVVLKRRYEKDGNLGLIFSNRAGSLRKNMLPEQRVSTAELPLDQGCNYPFYQVVIDYNGDVIMCAHDWEKRGFMGNICNQSFWEIWTGPLVSKYRQHLLAHNRRFSPCIKCDVKGDLIGGAHRQMFEALNL